MKKTKLAILDLYDNTPNQGMRCIKAIAERFEKEMDYTIFDVRGTAEVPALDFDIYISSGGPGSPLDGDGVWDARFYDWMQQVWEWNQNPDHIKKHVFFICHSFQMACHFFEVAEITARKSMSFGTFPVHHTEAGKSDALLQHLPDPFYAADFRSWQVVQPNEEKINALGAEILALEKIRPDVPLERAIMAMRFSDEIIGTQFHPEADPEGMLKHFQAPDLKKKVIDSHGIEKYESLVRHLNDPDKIAHTYENVLPVFLERSIQQVQAAMVLC